MLHLSRSSVTLRALVVCGLVLALAAPGIARPDPLDLLAGRAEDVRDAALRSRLARELAQDVGDLMRRTGPPSAEEQRAVLQEIAAIEGLQDAAAVNVRAHQLHDSVQFQQLRLHNTLVTVHEALRCAAAAKGEARREMTCWAIAGTYLGDRELFDTAFAALARSGRLTHDGGMTRNRWSLEAARWAGYGRAIHDYITIPYLRGAFD